MSTLFELRVSTELERCAVWMAREHPELAPRVASRLTFAG
jgi:hypothetical protein